MNLPFEYDQVAIGEFGGTTPTPSTFEHARVVVLPIPLDRTTSYVPGTRTGPHEILVASSHMELWDEETGTDVHSIGICTLPEMEFPDASMDEVMNEIERVTVGARLARQVPVRPRRRALDHAAGGQGRRQAIIRACRCCRSMRMRTCANRSWARPHNHACAMRRTLECAPTTQVGIRSLSTEEAAAIASLKTTIFYDFNMRQDENWIDRVVDSLSETVYITIDCDGLDPAIMPAVGTPEPGGLSWYETLGAAAEGHRIAHGRRLRPRGAVPDARQRGAEFSVREADLQDSHLPVQKRTARQAATERQRC